MKVKGFETAGTAFVVDFLKNIRKPEYLNIEVLKISVHKKEEPVKKMVANWFSYCRVNYFRNRRKTIHG